MGLCTSGKWILVRLSSKMLIKQFLYIYMYLVIVLCNLHQREELKFFLHVYIWKLSTPHIHKIFRLYKLYLNAYFSIWNNLFSFGEV